ncbi:MAG: putative extracytoplasmic binding receptor, partial [Pseudomonadota bacterium]
MKIFNWSLVLSVCLTGSLHAGAQTYPTKPVKLIVPFATGGPADNFGRFMAQKLTEA